MRSNEQCNLAKAGRPSIFYKPTKAGMKNFEKWQKREVIRENFMDGEKLKDLSDVHLSAVNARRQQKGLPPICFANK